MQPPTPEKTTLVLRSYSLAELARLYEVCDRTFKKWIKPFAADIGERQGRYYTINQVRIILAKLGIPASVTLSQDEVHNLVQHNPENAYLTRQNSS